jgi:hypothetical protein
MVNRFLHWLRVLASPAGAGCLCLALFLLLYLPSFLCMPPHIDISFFSVCARTVAKGGVLERDVLWFWFPGMAWILVLLQPVIGWSSEALQLLDFLFFTGIVWLLTRWMRQSGVACAGQVWIALALCIFFFSRAELVHCQPDVWMVFPALGALHLRTRQLRQTLTPSSRADDLFLGGLAEGLCWSASGLFKPFVMVPAALVFVTYLICLGSKLPPLRRLALADFLGVAGGAALVASLWVAQLRWSGGWPYFWESLHHWGREYYGTSPPGVLTRIWRVFFIYWPSSLVHAPALLIAGVALARPCFRLFARPTSPTPLAVTRRALFAAFYLGWLYQAIFIQFGPGYHLLAPLLFALVLLCETVLLQPRPFLRLLAPAAVLLMVLPYSILFDVSRLALWTRCLREGSTPQMKDRLTRSPHPARPGWVELTRVADHLRELDIQDGELTCYGSFPGHLHLLLDRKPSTRFFFLPLQLRQYPHRHDDFYRELTSSPQRYVVSDVREGGLETFLVQDTETGTWCFSDKAPPWQAQTFPWSEPIVFRAGPYLLHRVTRPVRWILADPPGDGEPTPTPP